MNEMLEKRLRHLMCKVSNGVYKKYQEKNLGIHVCTGKLSDQEIRDLGSDIQLLKYLSKVKKPCCDLEKLIETLT